jgi:hypothetical protein
MINDVSALSPPFPNLNYASCLLPQCTVHWTLFICQLIPPSSLGRPVLPLLYFYDPSRIQNLSLWSERQHFVISFPTSHLNLVKEEERNIVSRWWWWSWDRFYHHHLESLPYTDRRQKRVRVKWWLSNSKGSLSGLFYSSSDIIITLTQHYDHHHHGSWFNFIVILLQNVSFSREH